MNPLENFSEEESGWLAAIAEKEGLTPEEIKKRAYEVDDQIKHATEEHLNNLAKERGVTRKYLDKELLAEVEAERRTINFYQSVGVTVRGRYQAAMLAMDGLKRKIARSSAGDKTAKIRQEEAEESAHQAAKIYDSLTTTPKSGRANIIAKRMGITAATVRKYLRKTNRR